MAKKTKAPKEELNPLVLRVACLPSLKLKAKEKELLEHYLKLVYIGTLIKVDYVKNFKGFQWTLTQDEGFDMAENAREILSVIGPAQSKRHIDVLVTDGTVPAGVREVLRQLAIGRCDEYTTDSIDFDVVVKVTDAKGNFMRWGCGV